MTKEGIETVLSSISNKAMELNSRRMYISINNDDIVLCDSYKISIDKLVLLMDNAVVKSIKIDKIQNISGKPFIIEEKYKIIKYLLGYGDKECD